VVGRNAGGAGGDRPDFVGQLASHQAGVDHHDGDAHSAVVERQGTGMQSGVRIWSAVWLKNRR